MDPIPFECPSCKGFLSFFHSQYPCRLRLKRTKTHHTYTHHKCDHTAERTLTSFKTNNTVPATQPMLSSNQTITANTIEKKTPNVPRAYHRLRNHIILYHPNNNTRKKNKSLQKTPLRYSNERKITITIYSHFLQAIGGGLRNPNGISKRGHGSPGTL